MDTVIRDLIAFISARLDEDEQMARAATYGVWVVGPTFGARDNRVYVKPEGFGIDTIGTCVIAGQVSNTPEFRANAQHIARHDPARVLREVEAKRRLVFQFEHRGNAVRGAIQPSTGGVWDDLLRLLALPYADHPDFQAGWSA
jgi:hypothetical protein